MTTEPTDQQVTLQIVVTAGEDRGRSYPLLPGKTLVIGREPGSEILLADTKISRRHCKLSLSASGDQVDVEDLGSRNGCFINEQRLTGTLTIGKGDVLRVGRTRMEAVRADGQTVFPEIAEQAGTCDGCGRPIAAGDPSVRRILRFRVCAHCVQGSPHLGQVFGNFLVLWKIAEGGASILYRAFHTVLQTDVALKIFREEFAQNPRSVSRFIREARIGSQLSHPNVVRFFDAGRIGQVLYIAMEYVPGTDLAGLIAMGPVDSDFVRRIAVDILRALSYTAELRILHRDIKPGNILLTERALRRHWATRQAPGETALDDDFPTGDDVCAKLADFNISKAMRDSGLDTSTVTQPGSIVGTMFYMPPEQITDFANLDVRADLYGLGVSLYEALTGQRPFSSPDRNTLARHILNTPPIPPQQIVPEIPDDLNQAICKALEKNPDDRFATPQEMLVAVAG